jgi:hypothetical protein
VRSQRNFCCTRVSFHAVEQRAKPSFIYAAAKSKAAVIGSRTNLALKHLH